MARGSGRRSLAGAWTALALTAALVPAAAAADVPSPIDLGFNDDVRMGDVAALPGGHFLAVGHTIDANTGSDEFEVRELAGGATTRVSGPIAATQAGEVHLATSGDGSARLVWSANSPEPHLYTAAKPPGAPFGTTDQLTTNGPTAAPAVAMNASGASAIAYIAAGSPAVRFVDANGNVGPERIVDQPQSTDTTQFYADMVDVALFDDGRALVVWTEDRQQQTCSTDSTGATQCNYASDYLVRAASGDAGGFEAPVTIADTGTDYPQIEVAGDAHGGAVLVWQAGQQAHVALRAPGGAFGAPYSLTDRFLPPSVSVSRDGAVIIAYASSDPAADRPYVAYNLGSTQSATLGGPIRAGADDSYSDPQTAASDDGTRIVAWSEWPPRLVVVDPSGNARTRDENCGTNGIAGAALSDSIALVAFPMPQSTSDGSTTHQRIAGVLDELTDDRACPPPNAPPSPSSPTPYHPDPYVFNSYYAYANKRRRISSLLSPPAPNGATRLPAEWSDGASDHVSFSQDNRDVRLIAFDSVASDLLAGDTNGHRDVFVVRRAHGGGNLFGALELASVGPHGVAANGSSSNPSLDGETHAAPHCVAFESTATNLSPRDRKPDSDIYLRDLRTHRTILMSPGLTDAQHAVVDGRCEDVTFVARGSVWVTPVASGRPQRIARGDAADQQTNGEGVAYVRAGQIWYRSFRIVRLHHRLLVQRGREILASATAAGRRGNGTSSMPALDDSGDYVAFVSTATDLCGHACTGAGVDRNGHDADVFRRTLSKHAPTHDRMELATYSYDNRAQYGYGAANPVISAAGENVVYESSDAPGKTVLRTWEFPRARGWGNTQIVTRHCTANLYLCRGAPVGHPAISSRGNYLGFSSVGVEFCDAYVIVSGGRKACPQFSDVYVQYVGPSHEGHPLG